MEFFKKQTNFRFMATRKVWYTLSAIMIIGSFVALFTRGLNLAIDFTGGVAAEATFPGPVDVEKVRAALVAAGFHEPQVQSFGSSREIAIRMPPQPNAEGQPQEAVSADAIREGLEAALKTIDPGVQLAPPEVVGPQVGEELKIDAILALAFALFLIFIYIAVRFNTWRLSAGGILALMHDPILVLGIFAITQTSFDLAVVAAILAVVGYSINDTVVVFDRIRERFESNRRLAPETVLDQAINQTLSRTIMTKVTTLIVVLALLFLGGPVLKGFSEALMIGILAGTYSSIYISSAVALDLGLTAEHIFPPKKQTAIDSMP